MNSEGLNTAWLKIDSLSVLWAYITSLQIVDWLFVGVILFSCWISLSRGFIREAISLVTWFFAVIISMAFHEQLSIVLNDYISSPSLRKISAIISLFIFTMIIGKMVAYFMGHIVVVTGLDLLDRILGIIFGAMRGMIIVVYVLIIGQKLFPLNLEVWWYESVLIPHFSRLGSSLLLISAEIKDVFIPYIQALF